MQGRIYEIEFIVTGGAGFIGGNLVHRLLRQGFKAIGVDNF
jgi:nucleoside-diphosphate-sugar epimerase